MSHLSILPTLLRDVDLLAEALTDLGHEVQRGGAVQGFAGERVPVLLRLDLPAGTHPAKQAKLIARKPPQSSVFSLGWARQLDGSLALVGDLGRIAAASSLQDLLSQLSHRYALRQALQAAASSGFAGAELTLEDPVPTASSEPLAPSIAKPRPRS
jgi:hypothetical protein